MTMIKRFCFLWILMFFIIVNVAARDRLLMAQVIWRHGSRAPSDIYLFNQNTIGSWPVGLGRLTPLGFEQAKELGRTLRKRYIEDLKLINPIPLNSEVLIRSTRVNRTLESALGNIEGMFPRSSDGHYDVPIYSVPFKNDAEINVLANCPKANLILTKHYSDPSVINFVERHKYLFEFIETKTGSPFTLKTMYGTVDNLFCDKYNNLSVPSWLTPCVTDELAIVSKFQHDLFFGIVNGTIDAEFIRLRGGRMLKTIMNAFFDKLHCFKLQNTTHGECDRVNLKYIGYSAHDITIAYTLLTITPNIYSLFSGLTPGYSASVAFELWQTDRFGLALKILYRDGPGKPLEVITPKLTSKKGDYWAFSDFLVHVSPLVPLDPQFECATNIVAKRRRQYVEQINKVWWSKYRYPTWDVMDASINEINLP